MKKTLRGYQKRAVDEINSFFRSDKKKAKIYLSPGLGKTIIIVSVIEKLLEDNSGPILILSSQHMACEQIRVFLAENLDDVEVASCISKFKKQDVLVTTYEEFICNHSNEALKIFEKIICDDAQFIKKGEKRFSLQNKDTKFLGILQQLETTREWFCDADCLFRYTIQDAFRDGYVGQLNETNFINQFLIHLLESYGFEDIVQETKITQENRELYPDVIAEKDGKIFVIEVKFYRNLSNSQVIVNNALKQVMLYKWKLKETEEENKYFFVLVMCCKLDVELKKEIFQRYKIIIWDISNLMYLCGTHKELYDLLASCLAYPLIDIMPEKPVDVEEKILDISIEEIFDCKLDEYKKQLLECIPGKNNNSDRKYEKICTSIIKYLFETEFLRISEQHNTEDDMFRMDMLCSLKGTTEFWKFLIRFYHTKFVVFEYKNYTDYITQNLIYITEKYLFPIALRNVAFIISRKGFDANAQKAALGCLRESGKLIISLTDEDLLHMLSMKENGEEPSDYLLDQVESFLMSMSK